MDSLPDSNSKINRRPTQVKRANSNCVKPCAFRVFWMKIPISFKVMAVMLPFHAFKVNGENSRTGTIACNKVQLHLFVPEREHLTLKSAIKR